MIEKKFDPAKVQVTLGGKPVKGITVISVSRQSECDRCEAKIERVASEDTVSIPPPPGWTEIRTLTGETGAFGYALLCPDCFSLLREFIQGKA